MVHELIGIHDNRVALHTIAKPRKDLQVRCGGCIEYAFEEIYVIYYILIDNLFAGGGIVI